MSGRPASLPRQRQGAGRGPSPRASGGGGHVLHRLPLSRRGGHAHQRRRPGPHRGGGVERAGAGQPGTGLRRAGPALCPHHRPHPPSALPPAAAPPPPGVRLRPAGRLGHPAQYDGGVQAHPRRLCRPRYPGFSRLPRPAQAPAGQVGALVGGAVHRHGVQGLRRPRPPHTCSQPLRLRPVDVLFPILSCALFLALFFLLGR